MTKRGNSTGGFCMMGIHNRPLCSNGEQSKLENAISTSHPLHAETTAIMLPWFLSSIRWLDNICDFNSAKKLFGDFMSIACGQTTTKRFLRTAATHIAVTALAQLQSTSK